VKPDIAKAMLDRVAVGLSAVRTKASLLDDVAWPRDVEERFFQEKAEQLPHVTYRTDRAPLEAELRAIRALKKTVKGDGPIPRWLENVLGSAMDKTRLLLAVGTKDFGRISKEVYGGARSKFFGLGRSNLDLSNHLLARLQVHGWDDAVATSDRAMDARGLQKFIQDRVQKNRVPIKVILDPACTSKAIAGGKRVRIRPDAKFTAWEAEGLYRHEVETHAYSSLNGGRGPYGALLKLGGPRSTPTQEGLAVFAEHYHHALAVPRLRRLALRVKLVAMAEDGADFLEVYRVLVREQGISPSDAYLDTARIFRGGPPEGGAPFTKDACYLAGLLHVIAFLEAFVREGHRDECEMLVCGRFALEDLGALIELRGLGLLPRPRYRPRWLREWTTLLPYFAFTSFVSSLGLDRVTARYATIQRLAAAARSGKDARSREASSS
jgi:uncharacterized protein (TIGR02421 family)